MLAFILMGSLDWLTTIVGIVYFGAVETNPFVVNVAGASLLGFTAVKLSTTILVGLMFYQAERLLMKTPDKNNRTFTFTRITLRVAYIVAILVLLIAVLNNLIVVARVAV